MIITIARECGCGGHEIGEKLAQQLGIPLYDKEALANEAKKRNQYEQMQTFFNEKPINSLLYAIVMDSQIDDYEKIAFEMIRELAQNDMILIGRCGNYIFKGEKDKLSIFLHADKEDKIQRVMEREQLSQREALKKIQQTEDSRSYFHKSCTGQHWGESKNYDLCINTSKWSIDQCVSMILKMLGK